MAEQGVPAGIVLAATLLAATGLGAEALPPPPGAVTKDVFVQPEVTGLWRAVAPGPGDSFVAVGAQGHLSASPVHHSYTLRPEQGLVASYDASGRSHWMRSVDFGHLDALRDVVVDADGNAYAVGITVAEVAARWGWVFHFRPDGEVGWSRNLTIPGYDALLLQGVTLDGGTLRAVGAARAVAGGYYPFLATLATDGRVLDTRVHTAQPCTEWYDVAPGPLKGTFVVAGVQRLPPPSCQGGPIAGCVGLLDADLALAWHACDDAATEVVNVAVGSDFVAAAGWKVLGTGLPPPSKAVFQALTFAGDRQWLGAYDGGEARPVILAEGVAVDALDNVYVVGTDGTRSNDPLQVQVPIREAKVLAQKYNRSGALVWSAPHLGPLGEQFAAHDSAIDGQSRLLVAGSKFTLADPVEPSLRPLVLRYQEG